MKNKLSKLNKPVYILTEVWQFLLIITFLASLMVGYWSLAAGFGSALVVWFLIKWNEEKKNEEKKNLKKL